MGICCALHSVSDENIEIILKNPPLIWRVLAPDDPESYLDSIKENRISRFIKNLFTHQKNDTATEIPDLHFVEGENLDNDLDKAWQGIHYCLNKTDYEAEPPMDFITVGGELVGKIDVGYGPARVIKSSVVKEIDKKLQLISIEQLKKNYDPKDMERLDIYPNIWVREQDEGFDYIKDYFETLKGFIAHCCRYHLGMIIYLC